MYNEKVMEHFQNPHNYGHMDDPDGTGKVGNMRCGDVMHVYIKVKTEKGKKIISDIKFETFGCVAAIATSSMITDLVKGKTIEEALDVTNKDIVDSLGELPPVKIHCSVLAEEALAEAVFNYYTKNKLEIPAKIEAKLRKTHELTSQKPTNH